MDSVFTALGEVRASEASLASPFDKNRGFSEIINTRIWWFEIIVYYVEFFNASWNNYKLLYGLSKSGLSDDALPKLAIASRATLFAIIFLLGSDALGDLREVSFWVLEEIFKNLKQSLYGCSLAARSLLQGS